MRPLAIALLFSAIGCGKADDAAPKESVPSVPVSAIPGHESLEDGTHKEGPRLLPTEVYLRTYVRLIGGATFEEAERIARGDDLGSLFDSFADYLGGIGMPDYADEVTRASQTNALMIATFDRLAIALCVRAAEREIGTAAPALADRRVFAFDAPATVDAKTFAAPFDVLHVTFLGYPAALAETPRAERFLALYQQAAGASSSLFRLTPQQAGWAAVCYGLARHPELHAY